MTMMRMLDAADPDPLRGKVADQFDDKRRLAAVLATNDVNRLHTIRL